MVHLNNLSYVLEFIAFVVAIIYYKKFKASYYRYFIAYLFVALIIESFGEIAKIYRFSSTEAYNIYTFFEYNIVGLIYYKLTRESFSHSWIKTLLVVFNSIYITSFFYTELQNYTVLIGAVVVSSFMILFLTELLKSEKIIRFNKELPFWITVSFLMYYLTTIPYYTVFFIITIASRSESESLIILHDVILILVQICFISGLLWSTKQRH
ncbi:hypothetical protein [Polaribacter tangerinus]|uniref:hypothetical protein n=1 Tax=Polaribacter tangerinus TaxID=1920034 RepID=UPI000B4C0752|nr:hypothetical protein [Polaribacter tangerinus]